jgi:hypothetical protein
MREESNFESVRYSQQYEDEQRVLLVIREQKVKYLMQKKIQRINVE